MCNFLEYKGAWLSMTLGAGLGDLSFHRADGALFVCFLDTKVVYRRYASLFFVCGISAGDNELATLEIVHRYVEVLDRYFGNVSPLPSRQRKSNPQPLSSLAGVRIRLVGSAAQSPTEVRTVLDLCALVPDLGSLTSKRRTRFWTN